MKTRSGLMETYALTPLFIEHARKAIPVILEDFADVITRAGKPAKFRQIDKNEKAILKSLGCKSKKDSQVWRSLLLPNYMRKSNRDRMLWDIIGVNRSRDSMFSGTSWLDQTKKSTATEKLEAQKSVRETIKKVQISEHSNEGWESLAELYIDEYEDS